MKYHIQVMFDKHAQKFENSNLGFTDRLYFCTVVAQSYGVYVADTLYDSPNRLVLLFETDEEWTADDLLSFYSKAGAFCASRVGSIIS